MEYTANNSQISEGYLFATSKLPVFGEDGYENGNQPLSVLESPYYWWYRFLGLYWKLEAMKQMLKSGSLSPELEELGNPNKIDFKTWWLDRLQLFAEPMGTNRVILATSPDQLASFDSKNLVNMVVPLEWPASAITWHVKRIVEAAQRERESQILQSGRSRASIKRSNAHYKLSGKWSTEGFRLAYAVYAEKLSCDYDQLLTGSKKTPWADIGIKVGLPAAQGLEIGRKKEEDRNQRSVTTVSAINYYDNAKAFIDNSATRSFPR